MLRPLATNTLGLSPLVEGLRCLECLAPVALAEFAAKPGYPELGPDGWLVCTACGERYPVIAGTARMLDRLTRTELVDSYPASAVTVKPIAGSSGSDGRSSVKQLTAESFAYEWSHFGQPRTEWRKNFLDYMQPHEPAFFAGKLVLDVGAGSGRHTAQAAQLGARVVAIDIGRSIDVARRNAPADVLTVQADAERLPFDHGTFDFVMSVGVLHHLPDPGRALRSIAHYAAPGGRVHVYLYWQPERAGHRAALRLVTAARRVTVRMPHKVLHRLCYPLGAVLWLSIVLPYRGTRNSARLKRVAEMLPLKTYADYPFGVLVNDQFDRFSAPLERRYTRDEVEMLLHDAGLTDVAVLPNHGWIGEGRVPDDGLPRPPIVDRRISVIVTVRNDRDDLRELLPGLLEQTRPPDEIVIVDGGSTDRTLDVLDEFDFGEIDLRVSVEPGANIAAGRNAAVRLASHERIACTDAGCRLEPGWLAALEEALEDAELVGGVFVADAATAFERVLAVTHYPVPEELDRPSWPVRVSHRLFGRRYLPYRAGGRSMAFSRSTWDAVHGFPEHQYAGEDHAFARAVADRGFSAALAREAVVHWRPPGTWGGNASMFYRYCRGDIRSKGRMRHVVRVTAWTGAPWAMIRGSTRIRGLLLTGASAYIALPLRRAQLAQLPRVALWQIPLVVALKDLSQIAGAVHGVVDAIRGVPQPTPRSTGIIGLSAKFSAARMK